MAGAITGLDYAAALALLAPMDAAIAGPLLRAAETGAMDAFAESRAAAEEGG